jgi:penicillin amidase
MRPIRPEPCSPLSIPLLALTLLAPIACGDDDEVAGSAPDAVADAEAPDADPPDAVAPDASPDGGRDAGGPDATDAGDAGTQDEGIPIPGLSNGVTVRFDEQRVLHVECSTPEDCMAAQGYYHAAHRFGQMDFSRRAVQGTLTELYWAIGFGSETIGQDVQARTVFADRTGTPLWTKLLDEASPRTRSYLEAYTRGVNAWIDDLQAGRNDAQLTEDWSVFQNRIEPWTVEDSVSTVLLLVNGLTNRVSNDISFAQLAVALSPAELVDLFTLVPATDAVIDPAFELTQTRESPEAEARWLESVEDYQSWLRSGASTLQATLAKVGPADPHDRAVGSNNWVVASSQTGNGTTLLANDPHLSLSNPAIWYLVNLDATRDGGSFHVAGVSFPGFPGILLGQNGDISWGATTTVLDQSDAYLEQVVFQDANPVGVSFRGNTVPFTVDTETFANPADGSDMTMDLLYVPHHGPVIDLDATNGRATTLRWSAQDISTDVEVFPDLWDATSVDEAQAALEGSTTLGQNFVVIDDQDNIGWFPYNDVPARPWASPQTPPWGVLDGSSGNFEWGDPIPLPQVPQSKNPARGWIVTANNDMTGNLLDGDPTNDGTPYWQGPVATGYRAARASELVRDGLGEHDADRMRAIQADVRSAMGAQTVPAILDIAAQNAGALTPPGQSVRDALAAWEFDCPTGLDGRDPESAPAVSDATELSESKGCLAFHVAWTRLLFRTFGDELGRVGYPRSNARDEALARYLTAPETFVGGPYWDDVSTPDVVETSSVVVVAALEDAGAALQEYLGADEARWQWGRLHTVTLTPNDGRPITEGPFANDGGWYTVDVANPSFAKFSASRGGDGFTSNFAHTAGASMRLVCATAQSRPTEPPSCTIDLPGRQRFFSGAVPAEADLMQRHWLPNEPFPLRFSLDDVTAAAIETVELRPAE